MMRSAFNLLLLMLVAACSLTGCGVKGGLYLPPNQLPNAKAPAGADDPRAPVSSQQRSEQTIPAAALRNPATEPPAEMILDGSPY